MLILYHLDFLIGFSPSHNKFLHQLIMPDWAKLEMYNKRCTEQSSSQAGSPAWEVMLPN